MENSAFCVCCLIKYGAFVVLVTLTATLLSIIVDIEWDISKLTVSVIFSNGVTVPVVFHSDGWSTTSVFVFVVLGGIAGVSLMRTDWGFTLVPLAAVLTCMLNCGKGIRPCVVSMTTLLFLMKCNLVLGAVKYFFKTKVLAEVFYPISK